MKYLSYKFHLFCKTTYIRNLQNISIKEIENLSICIIAIIGNKFPIGLPYEIRLKSKSQKVNEDDKFPFYLHSINMKRIENMNVVNLYRVF